MNKIRFKIRLFLWILVFAGLFWLVWLKVVPGGEITYILSPKHKSDQLGALKPDDRLDSSASGLFLITGNPIYFTLCPPRPFEVAELTVKYRNPDKLPLLEAGILADGKLWRYQTAPLENLAIEAAAKAWHIIEKDDLVFLQREKKYESLDDFLANLPNTNEIAIYNYDLRSDFKINDYEPADEGLEISGLRGAWQFFTYIEDETLNINISLKDLNENSDPDTASLFLYYKDKVIDSRAVEDLETLSEGSAQAAEAGSIGFQIADLPAGVYKVELRAGSDIISDINSKQAKLSFSGRIELAETGKSRQLFTDSGKVQINTANPGSLQTVEVIKLYSPESSFADVIEINEAYRQFESQKLSGISQINLEKDGVIISGDGVFAFNEESLIDPKVKKIEGDLGEEVNYLLARYEFPDEESGRRTAVAEFDLSQAYQENGKYSLMISVPGLRADDDIADRLEIEEIMVKLQGKSVWGKILEIINNKR